MTIESVQPDLESRTVRAVTETMSYREIARALFEVTSESGRVYTVDLREPACECRDFQYREEVQECKHIRRIRIEVGQVDVEALEEEIARIARDLEVSAEQLESKAKNLAGQAAQLTEASDLLREVAK